MESLQDEIREIRKQLRLAMNGVISTSMREKGIVYKLNFGVPYPEIKEIARKHKPDGELAAALWKEDIREFKILATFLWPADRFPVEEARRWIKEIPYQEIAEHCARNLFARLPYRDNLAMEFLFNKEDSFARTVAFLILTDLFKRKEEVSVPLQTAFLVECMRSVAWKEFDAGLEERFSALQAMKYYGRLSEAKVQTLFKEIEDFKAAFGDSAELQEIYNELKFEFEYYR
ncbi:MAG: DNA alkylation repair protein [Parabacteroides sp.]|nr:DNA alkylation repair protein [Parabacteroides sp.]